MANLIKNILSTTTIGRGNRGFVGTTKSSFPLYTEWYNLIPNIEDLTINAAEHALIVREPLEDYGTLVEEAAGTNRKFYAIPSDGVSKTVPLGLNSDGPIELVTALTNDFGDTWDVLSIVDVLNPLVSDKPWTKVLVSDTGSTIVGATSNNEVYVSTDSGINWFLRKNSNSGIWKKIVMSANGIYQTAISQGGLIYVSSDSGATWAPKQSYRQWTDIAMSSSGQYQTAVVTNEAVYTSSDYGNTWRARVAYAKWVKIEMSSNGAVQCAFSTTTLPQPRTDLYISTDYGNTWVQTRVSWNVKDLNINSFRMSSNGYLQAIVGNNNIIYISQDAGFTWSSNEIGETRGGVLSMTPNGANMTAIVKKVDSTQPSGLSNAIYVSTDSGNTWIEKSIEGLPPTSTIRDIAISSNGTRQIASEYSANSRLYVSTDFGNTWSIKESKRNWSSIAISADGTKILATTNPGRMYMHTF